jgi:mRNA-degrading endonuclease RelE of RelBE toxin-antitoxin system
LADPPFGLVERRPEFDRDLKALKKKYRSLDEDLGTLIKSGLHAYHHLGIDTGHVERMAGVQTSDEIVMYKVVQMACKALKGTGSKSGMRVIYEYEAARDRVVLVEIYFKGDKENEDRERVRAFLKGEAGA